MISRLIPSDASNRTIAPIAYFIVPPSSSSSLSELQPPSNAHADRILFEAGALSKTVEHTYVCLLLIDLKPSEVTGPLAQFQFTKANQHDFLKLLQTLNHALGDDKLENEHLEEAFKMWWPTLEEKPNTLPPDKGAPSLHRSDREVLDELLASSRTLARDVSTLLSNSIEFKEREEALYRHRIDNAAKLDDMLRGTLDEQRKYVDELRKALAVRLQDAEAQTAVFKAELNEVLSSISRLADQFAAKSKESNSEPHEKRKHSEKK